MIDLSVVSAECVDLRLCIADVDVLIAGPGPALAVVDRMLAHVSRAWLSHAEPLRIDVTCEGGIWRIGGQAPGGRKTLGGLSALPQVAGAIISSTLAELAYARRFTVLRAAAIEFGGHALALIGDDWESCVALTAHLHTRGWRILGGDYALVSGDPMIVTAFRKVLYATSSSVDLFPAWYRRAIEASPWYSTSNVVAFYAVDPTLVDVARTWGEAAPLRAILRVDGGAADHPALEALDETHFGTGLRRSELRKAGITMESLTLGDLFETADLIEKWFASVPNTMGGERS